MARLPPLEILEHQLDEDSGNVIFSTRIGKNIVEVREDELFRWLRFNQGITQSAILKIRPESLLFSYTRAMMAFLLFQESPRNLFMLGLGGGSHARFVAHSLPTTKVIVVERFKRLAAVVEQHFGLPTQSAQFKLAFADAGKWIRATRARADCIVVDLFDSHAVTPLALKTHFYALCRERLRRGGVLVVNLMVTRDNDEQALLQPLLSAFDRLVLPMAADDYGNYIVLAFNNEPAELQFKTLRKRAHELEKTFQMPFRRYLDKLRESNKRGDIGFVF